MSGKSLRWILLVALLAVDFGALTAFTIHLFRGSSADASATPQPFSQVTSSTTSPSSQPVGVSPQAAWSQSLVENHSAIAGSPRYIVCGTVDRQGGAWLGTEGQGVWSYKHRSLQQYSVGQGLPEDGVCAVACDALGRIWAGHEAHGVSIFNGKEWRNYDRFSGPGGSHVFSIATSPVDGSVWIATENGLACYSLKNDSWTHFDRSTGLPSAEVETIAIDHQGDVFAALPDAGIARGTPADGYTNWTVTTGPDEVPAQPAGTGLPVPIITALLVTHTDTLYAGTTRGLAQSLDHGVTWSYIQGVDWAKLLAGSYDGAPDGFVPPKSNSPLMEDWITALGEDASGALWVGYRAVGYQVFTRDQNFAVRVPRGKISVVVPLPNQNCVLGSVGDGAVLVGSGDEGNLPAQPTFASALTADQFPATAKPLSVSGLDGLRQKVEALGPGADGVEYLSDDWETSGDWPGRYGTVAAHIMSGQALRVTDGANIALTTGPYRQAAMRYYEYEPKLDAIRPRGLIDPLKGNRTYWEHNDESYTTRTHPIWEEGPDIYVKIDVPAGVHRVSLYFCNYDGHEGLNELREFPLQVRRTGGPATNALASQAAGTDDNPILEGRFPSPMGSGSWLQPGQAVDAELAPILSRSYVPRYWYGVYKQFLVRGQGSYWIKIGRNHAVPCKVNGAFVDRLDGPAAAVTDCGPPWPKPPAAPSLSDANAVVQSAAQLWAALDGAVGRSGYAAVNVGYRTLAYQAAAANGAPADLLANWRWKLGAWTTADRDQFDAIYPKHAD